MDLPNHIFNQIVFFISTLYLMESAAGPKVVIHTCLLNIVGTFILCGTKCFRRTHGNTFRSKQIGTKIYFAGFIVCLYKAFCFQKFFLIQNLLNVEH